jgi:hypothetical protein
MSAMGGMPMPGGWTMSMVWMRLPEQTWPGAAASFLGMWIVMMVAMMLPSLVPMLWRFRQAIGKPGETSLGRLYAVSVPRFAAELPQRDMHFSLANDPTSLTEFLRIYKEGGLHAITAHLSRGNI